MGTLFEDEVTTRGEEGAQKLQDGIGVVVTQYFVHLSLFHALKYIKELGDTGIWSFTYRLNNVANRKLVVEEFARAGFYTDRKAYENMIEVKVDFKADDLKYELGEICH